jgi:hypothetical protein
MGGFFVHFRAHTIFGLTIGAGDIKWIDFVTTGGGLFNPFAGNWPV